MPALRCAPPLMTASSALPDAVEAVVPQLKKRDRRKAEENWDAMKACYASEDAAIAAAVKLAAVILPYGPGAERRVEYIEGCYEVLQDLLDSEEEVQEILTKNPGVLGINPAQLAKASADDVRRAASIADGVDNVLRPARAFFQGLSWWDEGLERPTVWFQEAEKLAEEDDEDEDDEDDEDFVLPELMVDGVAYLYDESGEYNGIPHVLFTLDGVPWGVYDPETKTKEEVEFVE